MTRFFFHCIIMFLSAMVLTAFADEELYYDDGTAHDTFIMGQSGIFAAMKFSPSQLPAKLITLKYYMPEVQENTAFKLIIVPADADGTPWDGNDLIEPFVISGGQVGWNEYDLSDLDITVEGDFFYVLTRQPDSFFAIGVDDVDPISLQAYDTDC